MEIQTLKAQFAAEFVDIREAAQIDDAGWESFQLKYLNNSTLFGADVKSRQVGWSFTAALDAFCDSRVQPGNPYVFVSINHDEAKEKIRYLRNIINATDLPVRPQRFVVDTQTAIELEDGTRFVSHPCRPPRGKPKMRIYLDEMAHYPKGLDRAVYTAAVPATTKGGYLRLGSSPLGAKGLFWEIITQSLKAWPGFVRSFIPWWETSALCKDRKKARLLAPQMDTYERVSAFGSERLMMIFENMFLEDFQQEYECSWVDELTAWLSWEVIKRNQQVDLLNWHAHSVDEALGMIGEISHAIATGQIESALSAGLDVGRVRDLTEFAAVGKATTGQMPYRIAISLDRVPFEKQKNCFIEFINRLPFTQVLVDKNGLGMQLAEDLERETGKAQGVDFTNVTKELWAVEARVQAEKVNTPLPPDRDLAYQIHSIKKRVSNAKNNIFDTERNEKHHADKFWAWALALWASKQEVSNGGFSIGFGRRRKR